MTEHNHDHDASPGHDPTGHNDRHQHGHGHENDQGVRAILRYLRIAPRMWNSEVNDAVVDWIAPQPGETVLDIGAGMGPATLRAAGRGASVLAIEPTPFMRRVVSTRSRLSRHRDKITVSDGAAETLGVADASVDAIWAVNTMHHWISPAEGAVEIARALAPGGRVIMVDENFADPNHPDNDKWKERHDDDDHHGFSMVDALEMGQLLKSAGLTDVEADHRDLVGRPVIAILAHSVGKTT